MSFIDKITQVIPEVEAPKDKRKLSFTTKLKWTFAMLLLFFILGEIPLLGLDPQFQFQFEQLALILGAKFGTIISLGIGPIVTGSIILQLLNGSGLINLDTSTEEGKRRYQGIQKLVSVSFVIIEAMIYVFFGGLSPIQTLDPTLFATMQWVLIGQLVLGGFLILFMDEVVQKWGFGSGISLFIVAGVSQGIFVQAFSFLDASGAFALGNGQVPVGKVFAFFIHIMQNNGIDAFLALAAIVSTVVVFAVSVYFQAMKVEIPLSFGRVRGYGIRWPLKFLYTSNIPVILIAALFANVQLIAQLIENWAISSGNAIINFFSVHVIGQINTPEAGAGMLPWTQAPDLITAAVTGTLTGTVLANALGYIVLMMAGATLFGYFWVQTAGQDAHSVAKQINSSGLQIPGFRKDTRVLERILSRYIGPLTIMGSLAVGFLAGLADLTGALSRGTGILLAVMIVYQLYEEIAKQHMQDLNPAMRKFIK